MTHQTTILHCDADRATLGVFSREGDRLRCDRFAAEVLPVTAGSESHWLEHTQAALVALRGKVRVDGPVVLVLPAYLGLVKFLAIPRVEPAKREKIIRFEAGQGIPYALADVVWDHVVADERETDLTVMLAAARLDTIVPLCAAVQAAGFRPRRILPAPLATLAAFRLVRPAAPGATLVLNLGARSTTLLLAEPKRFVIRALSFGGNIVTQQLASGGSHGPAEAVEPPECSVPPAASAMEVLATRLAQEITRAVLHFRRHGDMEPPASVILTGGDARLAGLEAALSARLKVPVEHLDVQGAVEMAGQASALADLVGAAATQLREGQPQVNLLPPGLRSQENLRRRQPWLIAAAVTAVAALALPALHHRNVAEQARRKAAALERELAPVRARDAHNRALLPQLEELKVRVAQLQDVQARRAAWLELCADLQDRLGRVGDVWLDKLQVTPATGGAPLRLVISGRMLDRANPLARVSEETTGRVKALLHDLGESPCVTVAEGGQRFDNSQPGILKFDFVLMANPARPL